MTSEYLVPGIEFTVLESTLNTLLKNFKYQECLELISKNIDKFADKELLELIIYKTEALLLAASLDDGLELVNATQEKLDIDSFPVQAFRLNSLKIELLRRKDKRSDLFEMFDLMKFQYETLKSHDDATKVKRSYANAMASVANYLSFSGQHEDSIEYNMECIEIFRELNDKQRMANIQNAIAISYHLMGDLELALQGYKKVLQIQEDLDEPPKRDIVVSRNNIALVHAYRGNLEYARENYLKNVETCIEIDDPTNLGATYTYLGNLYLKSGEYEKGIDVLNKALSIRRKINENYQIAVTLFELQKILLLQKKFKEAQICYEELFEVSEGINNQYLSVMRKIAKGLILYNGNNLQDRLDARTIFQEVIDDDLVNYTLTTLAIKLVIDFNIVEYRIIGEESLWHKTANLIDRFYTLAMSRKAPINIHEAMILKAQMMIVQGKLVEAENLLEETRLASREYGLNSLEKLIEQEQEKFQNQYLFWKALIDSNDELAKRIEKTQIEDTLKILTKKYG